MKKIIHTAPGIYFTESPAAAIQTLFKPHEGKTASGTFQKLENGILFKDIKGEKRAFLVMNKHGEKFFVSCCDIKGKVSFSFSLSDPDENFLGISGLSHSEETLLAEKIAACF